MWAQGARVLRFPPMRKLQQVLKAKAQKILGDLGAHDSARVAKDLIHLANKPRVSVVLPASLDSLLRPR